MIGREYANAGWTVKIADLDTNQSTSYDWHLRRLQNVITSDIAVERFRTVEPALKTAHHYDLLVVDGKPHSSAETLRMVEPATLAILPSGVSFEDHELTGKRIPASNLAFLLARTGVEVPVFDLPRQLDPADHDFRGLEALKPEELERITRELEELSEQERNSQ